LVTKPYPAAVLIETAKPSLLEDVETAKPYPPVVTEYHYNLGNGETSKPYPPANVVSEHHIVTYPYPPAVPAVVTKPYPPTIPEEIKSPVVTQYHFSLDSKPYPPAQPHYSILPVIEQQPITKPYPPAVSVQSSALPIVTQYHYNVETFKPYPPASLVEHSKPTVTYPYPPAVPEDVVKPKPYPAPILEINPVVTEYHYSLGSGLTEHKSVAKPYPAPVPVEVTNPYPAPVPVQVTKPYPAPVAVEVLKPYPAPVPVEVLKPYPPAIPVTHHIPASSVEILKPVSVENSKPYPAAVPLETVAFPIPVPAVGFKEELITKPYPPPLY
jgi:hypothetical protein